MKTRQSEWLDYLLADCVGTVGIQELPPFVYELVFSCSRQFVEFIADKHSRAWEGLVDGEKRGLLPMILCPYLKITFVLFLDRIAPALKDGRPVRSALKWRDALKNLSRNSISN